MTDRGDSEGVSESVRQIRKGANLQSVSTAKCMYKMCICVCLLIYAKICISKCSPGASLLLLLNRC